MSDESSATATADEPDAPIDWPTVSVVMPVLNEADHLDAAVRSILTQRYPLPFDVCLAIAPSSDGTEHVAITLADAEPRVRVVSNPAGDIPAGLNAAIRATTGRVIVRVDGHARLADGYIERAVRTLVRTGAVNVGGRQVPVGTTPFGRAVAAATTSWLGTGGAEYRMGGAGGPVDTVYLGVFRREAGDAVGWYDESLLRNEDYELNIRLRAAGGTVWFDPELATEYAPRATPAALARQYHDYGIWKAVVVRRHPGTLRARQFVPAAMPVVVITSLVAARRHRAFLVAPLVHLSAVAAMAVSVARRSGTRRRDVALTYLAMHWAWGTGVWRGVGRIVGGSIARRVRHVLRP